MRNRLVISSVLAAMLVIAGVAPGCAGEDSTSRQIIPVKRGDIAITVASDGNLALINDRKITFNTSGIIQEVNFKEGDRVSAGQVLARIDTTSLDMTIAQANLAVKVAELDLEIATDSFKKITYPYTYFTFAIGIPDSLAAMADAERNIRDIQTRIKSTLTAEELSTLQTDLKAAVDSLTIAEEKLGRGQGADVFLSGQLPISSFWVLRDTQLNMDKAQVAVEKAKNDLKKAADELPKTILTVPFDGVLAQVNVKEGDTLSSVEFTSKVAFYLVDPDNLELKGTIDEIDIAIVKLGQKASITLDALPDLVVNGEVSYISPVSRVEGGVVVYDVKIRLEHKENPSFKSGMTAKADIIIEEKTGVLIAPERAIVREVDRSIMKVMAGEAVEERVIVTGISDGLNTEIVSGLNDGDEVVIERRTQ